MKLGITIKSKKNNKNNTQLRENLANNVQGIRADKAYEMRYYFDGEISNFISLL